ADDFVIVDNVDVGLWDTLTRVDRFLQDELFLRLHPGKVSIKKFRQGVDFLGYVVLPHYIVLRTKTKNRIFRKMGMRKLEFDADLITAESFNQSVQSYFGILEHCHGYKIERAVAIQVSGE
ncbi:MAG: hypothetical protein V1763_02335, partial [Parcubacteria group bacterium]